jgi:hypothetical protein
MPKPGVPDGDEDGHPLDAHGRVGGLPAAERDCGHFPSGHAASEVLHLAVRERISPKCATPAGR